MAVQKSKKSRSRRDQRRSHDALNEVSLSVSITGEVQRRHNVSADGFYRGKKVTSVLEDSTVEDEA